MNMMEYGLLTEDEMNAINQGNELTTYDISEVKTDAVVPGMAVGLAAGAAGYACASP